MYRTFLISLLLFILLFSACENQRHTKESFKISLNTSKLNSGDSLTVKIKSNKNLPIDSVRYYYHDQLLKSTMGNPEIHLRLTAPLGKRSLSAQIFSKENTHTIQKEITLYAAKAPQIYHYRIIKTYPHDPMAFTQGLEFHNDTLYEGTGLYGVSELRKVDLETGKVLKRKKLDRKYFGEGITILGDKIYQLTWREGVGFIYDLSSFKKEQTFKYNKSKEGWGLCNDGKHLYKSDGSDKIWMLDPKTLEEIDNIEPVTHKAVANQVNELEWVKGKIYANMWQKDGVLIINPKSGAVEGVIDFRGLKDKLGNKADADVLNGIAYNSDTDKLYVTGKKWDKLFQVEIIKN